MNQFLVSRTGDILLTPHTPRIDMVLYGASAALALALAAGKVGGQRRALHGMCWSTDTMQRARAAWVAMTPKKRVHSEQFKLGISTGGARPRIALAFCSRLLTGHRALQISIVVDGGSALSIARLETPFWRSTTERHQR